MELLINLLIVLFATIIVPGLIFTIVTILDCLAFSCNWPEPLKLIVGSLCVLFFPVIIVGIIAYCFTIWLCYGVTKLRNSKGD